METEITPPVDPNSDSVIAHLKIYQGIISRMARNSAITKTWCVTLVAAILVLVARTGEPFFALIGLVPIVVFAAIDSYYLVSERAFRRAYKHFVVRLHEKRLTVNELYLVEKGDLSLAEKLSAVASWSILPFYAVLAVAVVLVFLFVWLCM